MAINLDSVTISLGSITYKIGIIIFSSLNCEGSVRIYVVFLTYVSKHLYICPSLLHMNKILNKEGSIQKY